MKNKPPVGWIPGHSYKAPYGVNVPGFKPEYHYNRDILTCAQYAAYEEDFDRYCIIDYPSSERSYQAIGPQVLEAEKLECPFAIEVHLNADLDPRTNYGVAFYHKENNIARHLAELIASRLYQGLKTSMMLSKFISVGLPDERWSTLRSISLSSLPFVLIEPFFLTATSAQQWIRMNSSIPGLGRQIMQISKHYLEEIEGEK